MAERPLHVVTGAFGYSGKYIAARLLDKGYRVRTLTNSVNRTNPFAGRIEVAPLNFAHPDALTESLRGASVLYNTYWVRFNHKTFTFADAVKNTQTLFQAAARAGIRRIVHISITNPSKDSPFEYFRGKAVLEQSLMQLGIPYAILRPAVLFGREDILVNNIAWMLRRFPVFGVFGKGNYRLRPIHVDDLADLAVAQAHQNKNAVIDAVGPETFTYRDLVRTIGEIIGKKRRIISIPPALGYLTGWIVGKFVDDVTITRSEIGGLMADLLCTNSPPAGPTRLTDWARQHAASLGIHYASELARRKDRDSSYDRLYWGRSTE